MQAALDGDFIDLTTELDIAIQAWHESTSNLEVYEYLGMTWDEYKQVVPKPKAIYDIVSLRKNPKIPSRHFYNCSLDQGKVIITRSDGEPMNLIDWNFTRQVLERKFS